MRRTSAGLIGLLLVAIALPAGAGCRDADDDVAIRGTVARWVDAWARASGPERDNTSAAQARAALGGELLTRTETAARDAAGEPRGRLLARMFNDFVGVAIPPDRGHAVLAVERTGDSARVVVQLRYSGAAPGAAAAAGLLPFNQVAGLGALAARPPERVFTLTRVGNEWRIVGIRAA